ncbi:hypothetical protein C1X64_04205 [Pseudomonas sp. GW456-E7]|nr:hypothetical protein C1X64_04205 [Pseudomonas sp. GW456-E7]
MRWPWILLTPFDFQLSPVGAAEGCDLLILIFGGFMVAKNEDQKIAAFGSSYRVSHQLLNEW